MTTYSAGDGRIIIRCNVGQCITTITVTAPNGETARAIAAQHNYGWYTRRQRRKVADACQWHLGGCCIHHTRQGEPGVDPAAILPAPRLEPMSSEAAAWVREQVWTGYMRTAYSRAAHTCACQRSGQFTWCKADRHTWCDSGKPRPDYETLILDRNGIFPTWLPEPFKNTAPHPCESGDSAEQPLAFVWLADRVCQTACTCDCVHMERRQPAPKTTPSRPVRYETVMLPGFDLVDAP